MPTDVANRLRQQVAERAEHRCEYCLLPEAFAFHKHEVDHIIPTQHGGDTEEANLAFACMRCNRHKGPNVGSFDPETGELVPFFNPRQHRWSSHFMLEEAVLQPLTAEARVTVKILDINNSERLTERRRLLRIGLYQSR